MFRFTIRCAASVSEIVITAGRASGTTATASADLEEQHLQERLAAEQAQDDDHGHENERVQASSATWSRLSWSGVFPRSIVCSIRAIPPSSVSIPVATTTARPRP